MKQSFSKLACLVPRKQQMKPLLRVLSVTCLTTLAVITSPILFLSVITLVEFLQSGYDRIRETISMLVLGPYGWIVTIIFFLFGFLLVVFSVRLYVAVSKSISLKVGTVLLILVGLGFFIIGIFPTQDPGTTLSLHALIHRDTAGAISILFALACFALAFAFKAEPRWRRFWKYTIVTGSIILILIILAVVPAFSNGQFGGLHERLLLITGLVWVTAIAIRLLVACVRERENSSVVTSEHL